MNEAYFRQWNERVTERVIMSDKATFSVWLASARRSSAQDA